MADVRLLRRLCLDVLHRNPTPQEVQSFDGFELADVAKLLLWTEEAMSAWVEEEFSYFLLLDRFRPTNSAVGTLPERLRRRRATARDALTEILLSSGFSLRNPGNDTFVTVVLEQCLGLTVQDRKAAPILAAGKKVYDGYKTRFLGQTGRNQADVVKIVLGHRDCTAHLLDRHHRRLLRRPLPKDADAVVDRVHEDPEAFFEVLAEWLGSTEYARPDLAPRPLTHFQFTRSLYIDLLGRPPEYEELRNMRNAMLAMADPTPLRAALVKVILDARRAKVPEAPAPDTIPAFVRRCFLAYLRRPPSQQEQTDMVRLFREESATPRQLLRSLLGSVEYGFY